MSKSYSEQIRLIKQDVRKTYDAITRDLAKQAKKDLQDSTYSIIRDFYYDRKPDYYVRTNNLFNMVNPENVLRKDNGHMASVVTTSYLMFDNYNCPPEWVYNLMWNQGHRGLPFQDLTPTWNPQATTQGKDYISNTPHSVMTMFLEKWGKDIGRRKIDDIDKKYKSKEYKTFR